MNNSLVTQDIGDASSKYNSCPAEILCSVEGSMLLSPSKKFEVILFPHRPCLRLSFNPFVLNHISVEMHSWFK